jgi:hypothetical protein
LSRIKETSINGYEIQIISPSLSMERIRESGLCAREVRCPESAEGLNEQQTMGSKKIFR